MSNSARVSVVIVNYKGVEDTLEAIAGLMELEEYSEQLEIIVVDNASEDGSFERLESFQPRVVAVPSKTNLGFAGGCNLGASHARGEIIAFLNSDARPEKNWVSAALQTFDSYENVGAVASRVLSWDGRRVDFSGSAMAWYGMGYRPRTGEKVSKKKQIARPVLFGTGSAMFVRRKAFEDLGGFDESFFMFFEDVDFGWRLNLAGWDFVYEPDSLAFHRHHGSMGGVPEHREQFLLERNALFCLYKNLEDEQLQRVFAGALLASVRRAVVASGLTTSTFDLSGETPITDLVSTKPDGIVPLFAMDQFVEALPELTKKRKLIQKSRNRSDVAIWRLFGETNAEMSTNARYLRGYDAIVEAFSVLNEPAALKILIITGDPIGRKLSGPGIRSWHMAKALSRSHDVTLLSLSGVDEAMTSAFRLEMLEPGDDKRFVGWESWSDVILFQGHAMDLFPQLRATSKHIIVDIYDPIHLEQLEQSRHLPKDEWAKRVADASSSIESQLQFGDFFLCASERQRHFYLGQLTTVGRIGPQEYANDPHLSKLLAVVPFGLPEAEPRHERAVMRGVTEGINDDDAVIVWSGGIYDWFDPLTLISAVAALSERRPEVKLFFMGTAHPHPGVPAMPIIDDSRSLAQSLGVLDRHVFFNESWTDYDDRQNFLMEADLGVSTHKSHIETTFSFRTRILDYLWASLPMVVTEGDHFADEILKHGFGKVVPEGDIGALELALEVALFDKKFRSQAIKAIERAKDSYRWQEVLEPLISHVTEISEGKIKKQDSRRPSYSPARPRPPRFSAGDIERGFQRIAQGEFRSLGRAVLRKFRRRPR